MKHEREWYEAAFGDVYPIVYPHRDDGEATRVAETLTPLIAGRSPLLDVACGNGRYMAAFAAHGLEVFGVDLSEPLLGEAVHVRDQRGRVALGDMRRLPVREESIGAVINMFTSFGYFQADLDNLLVVREAARVLRPGGVFVIDFINATALRPFPPGTTERREGGHTVEETREFADGGRVLVKRVRVLAEDGSRRAEYEERVRLYTAEELATMAESAGLRVTATFGDYGLGAYVPGVSERVILVCEKPGADRGR